jgi:hypothetical protein
MNQLENRKYRVVIGGSVGVLLIGAMTAALLSNQQPFFQIWAYLIHGLNGGFS